ncbi:MAG: GH92 family glycosyl hydrolase [Bacteroidales bacterium]
MKASVVKFAAGGILLGMIAFSCKNGMEHNPADLVNSYIGSVSHLLVPTYPTVHLPNSMIRFYPLRDEYTSNHLRGFPVNIVTHRWGYAMSLLPYLGKPDPEKFHSGIEYDQEEISPYSYQVALEDGQVQFGFVPAARSGRMSIRFHGGPAQGIMLHSSGQAEIEIHDRVLSGFDTYRGVKMYIWMEFSSSPGNIATLTGQQNQASQEISGDPVCLSLEFPASGSESIELRYGVSFISTTQAEKNLQADQKNKSVFHLRKEARDKWNEVLSKIEVEGGTPDEQIVFYTSLYRCFERMVDITEDGKYYSAWSNRVENAADTAFYTDDWVWDTHLALHPLQVLINPSRQDEKINSYIRMGRQSGWIPTFPSISGDDHCMNGNHFAAVVLDAWVKGIRGFSLEEAYRLLQHTLATETRIPWVRGPVNSLDSFYNEHGYMPALQPDEPETVPAVHGWEKRQAVAVTLASCYDDWCMAQIAKKLGQSKDYEYYIGRSRNYLNLFNPETGFYHPKDAAGNWILPFDYRYSGGIGCRDYYDENNGWTYLWQPVNALPELANMLGGPEAFSKKLDMLFSTGIGMSKWQYAAIMPDASGCTGQFVMGNEPSLHIPYLYNLAGKPWMTQKRIRHLMDCWFRNDLMGIPGDEDGGGLSAFFVFSAMGFYPVTPGIPEYQLGSPLFDKIILHLQNGKSFTIQAKRNSKKNKYIQSVRLNGKPLTRPIILHSDIINGGKLDLLMGEKPAFGLFNYNAGNK